MQLHCLKCGKAFTPPLGSLALFYCIPCRVAIDAERMADRYDGPSVEAEERGEARGYADYFERER